MLSIFEQGLHLCDNLTRREWLRIGSLGAFGATLPAWLEARANNSSERTSQRRIRSCILLSFLGAPPQHETWDPKPDAPAEIRGDLKPMVSAVPGLLVGELMPKTAAIANKIAVLRAVHTGDHAHSSSGYYLSTGRPHQPLGAENAKPGAPNDWPCLGAVVKRLWNGSCSLPTAITLPEQSANDGNLTWPGQDAGFLGRAADPWLLTCEPELEQFQLPGLALPQEVPPLRFDERRTLLDRIDSHLDASRNPTLKLQDVRIQQALDMIHSSQARRAFQLDREPTPVRERYGRYRFGQSTLLARRLVEAGVPFIRVNWTRVKGAHNNGHWDTHSKNTEALKQLMPLMDQTYSALIEDLSQRGLLEDTLVVWMGEFGRTPKINGAGGRDHWGHVFSVALAGGGTRGGVVYGSSDKIGGHPREGKVTPPDLHATVLHCLGIAPESEIQDSLGRPIPATRGEVIRQVV